MNTLFLLMAEFNGRAEIPLSEICEQYFDLSQKKSKQRAAAQQLPVPVHRLGSQKSKWMVNLADLAAYIDAQRAEAIEEWKKVNAA